MIHIFAGFVLVNVCVKCVRACARECMPSFAILATINDDTVEPTIQWSIKEFESKRKLAQKELFGDSE